jgi:fatty-acyl-CoA synthase
MRIPLTTTDFLIRAEAAYGNRIGVVDDPDSPDGLGSLTYRQLAVRARALAAGFDELGVEEGGRVAVISHNSARLLELLLATTMTGRVLVPINFRLSPVEVDYIVGDSGASLVLVDAELDEPLHAVDAKTRLVLGTQSDDALLRFGVEARPWGWPDQVYTSGTTARPKGVQLTHRNIWTNALTFSLHIGMSDRDVYLHTLPLFHVNGWNLPFALAGLGVPQILLRKVDGAEILRRVEQYGVTLMCGAPAVLSTVLEAAATWEGAIPGAGRTRIVCAGAPPPTRVIERVETELGWEFLQIYGLTETSPVLTVNRGRAEWDELPLAERARRLSRAGAPALGTTLRIAESGEVLARGNQVLASYWQNPSATADALEGGEFHTGDGGSIDDEGYLTISDRKKDVIITGGENVSSIEVEDRIFRHPDVAEVAVIGVPHEKWGETILALVVPIPGSAVTAEDIIAFCREGLAHFKCPTVVELRGAIPRTATGKVQKFRLREPYWAGLDRAVH